MPALALHHLAVVVGDLAQAEAFYVGVLGLAVIRRWDDERRAPRSVWVALAGEAFLAIELASARGPVRVDEAPGFHCVALAIAAGEREAWRERLVSAGFAVERETAFTLYTRDPDGGLVGLSHYPT